ncbi:NAD(P)-dependent oxidoreductase [Deferribacterales bacterium Es71-Z0220]|jgi:3-hydroxyisobutyrate dehydrogenase|uniref:NAD(P)-dependent oxidoreductase n=1 Tax=Deferrivibrio essentukiensis TaxID=2880922 RepID=UPI001F60045E|nr:NAD(P)-dependent oxidoreductase [Deferrivibrio essentukiensis]MBZ4672240.1 3-hydroxyisobutyrate dehydrogenase [Deferribacteraceae bacterium]MCB4203679.1 NAD(P)-dependent oxidoreductase [Deferrivibrio essentukiensis]
MKISFVGLGKLGSAIATNLSSYYDIVGFNRTFEKVKNVKIKASSLKEIAENDIIILNLSDSIAVDEILFGENGLINFGLNNKIIIDTTTNHFESVLNFHQKLSDLNSSYVEAPVIGSVVPALNGQLTVLASCGDDVFGKIEHILKHIGKKVIHFTKEGLATKLKLINNLVMSNIMFAISEALAFGEKIGIEKNNIMEVLENGAGNSLIFNAKKEKLLTENFDAHFDLKTLLKDLNYADEMFEKYSLPILSNCTKNIYSIASNMGYSEKDFSSIYMFLKNIKGDK